MTFSSSDFRTGLLFGLIAYLSWGLVPLFFARLRGVPAAELLAHRIIWSISIMLFVTMLRGGGYSELARTLVQRRLVLRLFASATFLAINWLLYIYATVTDRVTDASLGYYAMPLVNALFARLFLGEQLRTAHHWALTLIAVGVIAASIMLGTLPWLAIAIPVTFGCYGIIRKRTPVDSMTGLLVETLILLTPSVAYLCVKAANSKAAFGPDAVRNGWLMFSGVMTVVPLLTFTLSIRRLPFLTQSCMQFISPSVQALLAVFVLGEEPHPAKLVAMVCVWFAVGIFILDAYREARQR